MAQKQKQLAEEAAEREGNCDAEAEQQRDLAQKATEEAEAARQQAETVTDFLVEIFRSPDPERDGRTITVAEMLNKAGTRIRGRIWCRPAAPGAVARSPQVTCAWDWGTRACNGPRAPGTFC